MRKVFIKTHGCQMNEYDSEKMLDLLSEKEEFESTNNPEEADGITGQWGSLLFASAQVC